MNSPIPHRRPIGQILIAQGVISEDQLRIALLEQMKSNQPVGKLLVSLGFVSEATLRDALGESLGQRVGRPRSRHRRSGGVAPGAARTGQAPRPAAAGLFAASSAA